MTRLALALTPLLAACQVIVGNGVPASETREVAAFERVSHTTFVDVAVEVGPEASVLASCDENLLSYLITDVEGDTLRVRTRHGVALDPAADCRVEITMPALRGLEASGSGGLAATGDLSGFEGADCSGSGNLWAAGIAGEDVLLRASGSGSVTAAGTTSTVRIESTGSGGVDARDLLAGCASVESSGSGDVRVSAEDSLEADLSGSGDVEVWGDPEEVDVQTSGSGTVSHH